MPGEYGRQRWVSTETDKMFHRELTVKFPKELLEDAELNIVAIHFTNEILLHIRCNGEMDTTYEVSRKGLRPLEQRYLVDHTPCLDDDDQDGFVRDNLADYQVVPKLGDSNDTKLPVICTQIAELYLQTILSRNVDGLGNSNGIESRNLLITMCSKIWKQDGENARDFDKLVYVLKSIKDMYL